MAKLQRSTARETFPNWVLNEAEKEGNSIEKLAIF